MQRTTNKNGKSRRTVDCQGLNNTRVRQKDIKRCKQAGSMAVTSQLRLRVPKKHVSPHKKENKIWVKWVHTGNKLKIDTETA